MESYIPHVWFWGTKTVKESIFMESFLIASNKYFLFAM